MNKVAVFNVKGEKKDDLTIKIADRYLKLNENLISQVLRVEQNHLFKKSGYTKTKGEVAGGGRKPWKQKGTGRARAGSTRSPIWRGGGVTFGPTGQSRILSINPKMKKLAHLQVLAKLISNKSVIILDDIEIKSNKTNEAVRLLEKISEGGRSSLILVKEESESLKPWRNIALLETFLQSEVLMSDLLKSRKFIFSEKAFSTIEPKFLK